VLGRDRCVAVVVSVQARAAALVGEQRERGELGEVEAVVVDEVGLEPAVRDVLRRGHLASSRRV
jgi:hypothetical protein